MPSTPANAKSTGDQMLSLENLTGKELIIHGATIDHIQPKFENLQEDEKQHPQPLPWQESNPGADSIIPRPIGDALVHRGGPAYLPLHEFLLENPDSPTRVPFDHLIFQLITISQ